MTRFPCIWLFPLLLFTAFLSFQEGERPADPLELIPKTLDFGRVFDGDSPLKSVVIKNRTTQPLSIMRISTTCGCAIPRIVFPGGKEVFLTGNRSKALGVLQAGEEAKIDVTFQTWGYKGKLNKRIDIKTDAKVGSNQHISVIAEIVDSVQLDPPVLDLGEVVRGQAGCARIRLRSLGIGDFDVERIKNLPPYLTFKTERLSHGEEAEHLIEIRTREEPPLGEWSLILQVAVKNRYIDTTRIPLQAEILPKVICRLDGNQIEDEIDFGVFSPQQGRTLVAELVNLVPEIPYKPLTIHLENPHQASAYSHRLETVKEGEHYRIHLTIQPGAGPASFVRSWLVIRSDHPDMLEKRLHLIGWASQQG